MGFFPGRLDAEDNVFPDGGGKRDTWKHAPDFSDPFIWQHYFDRRASLFAFRVFAVVLWQAGRFEGSCIF
jgi:hypothetical protein